MTPLQEKEKRRRDRKRAVIIFSEAFDLYFNPRERRDERFRSMTMPEFLGLVSEKGGKTVDEAAVRHWRNGENLPTEIEPIVEVVRLDDPALADKVFAAWTNANSRNPVFPNEETVEALDGVWVDDIVKKTSGLAILSLHPDSRNFGPAKCRIDMDLSIGILKGEATIGGRDRAVSVGLREALLAIDPAGLKYEPDLLAGGRTRESPNLKRDAENIQIVGPLNIDCKRIDGEPLDLSHLVTVERVGDADPVVTVEVRVSRRAFKAVDVDKPNDEVLGDNRDIILNQLLGDILSPGAGGAITLAKAFAAYKSKS